MKIMKQYKTLAILLLSVVVLTSFTRCSSLKKTNTIDSNKDILKLDWFRFVFVCLPRPIFARSVLTRPIFALQK